jgi:signal peptidase I
VTTRERATPLRGAVEWFAIIVGAVLAALLIKTFLLQAFYIPSASMEHTLEIRDRVLVNKLSYRLHDVHRGDLVVFERPKGEEGDVKDLIKRVVGLPGETVEGRDGQVYVDGTPLAEPYLSDGVTTSSFPVYKVPGGQVWVMGDNRSNSKDSRVFKSILESRIVGRAFIRVWPVTSIRLF